MADFILEIEAKITAKPVTPKLGLTQRKPYERNLFVLTDKVKVYYNGTKASLAILLENAMFTMKRQWALDAEVPPQGAVLAASSVAATTCTLNSRVHPGGASTAVTFEYGTTPALGTSVAATGSPFTDNDWVSPALARTGLTASTQYYYRVKMVKAPYTIWSDIGTFKTLTST